MNIVVTGASRGIGKEAAIQLAQQGHKVLVLSRNQIALDQLAEAHHSIKALVFDLKSNDYHGVKQAVETFFESRVDAIINNAGYLVNKPFTEITPEELQNVYEVNVFGPFKLTQLLLPFMKESKLKHIVNISSMGGVQGSAKFPGLSAYSSSKAAIASLSECLAEEFKETGVKVNALALGAVQTEMLSEAFPDYQAPLNPEQMAAYIVDFTLNQSIFYNGKVLSVSSSTP